MTGDFYVVIDGDIREARWSLDNWGTFKDPAIARDTARRNATVARPLAVLTVDSSGVIQNRRNYPEAIREES